jgi:N-acetylneuraminate synthase
VIIERNLAPYVVYSEDPLPRALEKISANKARIIFCTTEHGVLEGVLTDGDLRRWIAEHGRVNMEIASVAVANHSYTSASIDTPGEELRRLFRPGVDHIPLMDTRGRIVAVAIDRPDELRIGPLTVSADSPTVIIAEIGINHNGSVARAIELVDEAAKAKADCVKFQLRDMSTLYRQSGDDVGAGEDLGPQYTLDLLSRFSLEAEQLFEVFDHCATLGLPVICTPWDLVSVDALAGYGVPALKIASADLTNHELLAHAAATGLPLVLSTGMSTEVEIRESVQLLEGRAASFALLQCNSTYPAPFKDINLKYLQRLAEIGRCPVGYSGHERGVHVPVAAVALGAKIIEKHFTLDRGLEGNDHKVSLLPAEFAEMVVKIREVEEALGVADERVLSQGEMMNRVNLAKSLVAVRDLGVGDIITADAVSVRSPGRGLQPNARTRLVGRKATRVITAGDYFYATDLGDVRTKGRDYHFRRPWGLPVRFHDVDPLLSQSNPDFLEFHLSYKDMDLDPNEIFDTPFTMGYTVHSPDLFANDHIIDLASTDDEHRKRSIAELQRVVDLTRTMAQWFPNQSNPIVIMNVGGFTRSGFVSVDERREMYQRVDESFNQVDAEGVELCAQTIPPFPWLMGGQLYGNLFLDADDSAWFAETFGRRLCLDTSHSQLAATHLGRPFAEMVEQLAPHAAHLHLVDATGVDGEGVQVGDGDIDWPVLARQLDELAPGIGFIPEIWQGHVNDGEGFWVALERLEQLL